MRLYYYTEAATDDGIKSLAEGSITFRGLRAEVMANEHELEAGGTHLSKPRQVGQPFPWRCKVGQPLSSHWDFQCR